MQLYHKTDLLKRSFFQKLFGQHPEQNAVLELNNYLASLEIKDITPQLLRRIQQKYRVNLIKEYSLNLEEFYAVYLNYCLLDSKLEKDEIEN